MWSVAIISSLVSLELWIHESMQDHTEQFLILLLSFAKVAGKGTKLCVHTLFLRT